MTDVKGDLIFEDKTFKAIIDKINIDDKGLKLTKRRYNVDSYLG